MLALPLATAAWQAPRLAPLRRSRLMPKEDVASFWTKDDSSPLSLRLAAMMEHTPSLQAPEYHPTPWARASSANFALATLRSRLGELRRRMEPPLLGRVTPSTDPDVVVEWAKDPVGYALPADAPIVIFLHTITGSAAQTRWLMKYASLRGWRSCTFVRRGHGGPLRSPSFNLLGSVDDIELQLEAVRTAYPRAAFLGMVGVSAGSAQLISYLGRAGASTPVGAACAICPAWDVPAAFGALGETRPVAERAMVASVKRKFLRRANADVLRSWDADAFERCRAATTLPELMDAHAPFAMRRHGATAEGYYAAHDPLADRHGVSVPTMILNSADDFVCPASLAQPDLIAREQPGALMLLTRHGSHVAFNEGLLGRGSFHMRTSFDFLDAAHATALPSAAAVTAPREDPGGCGGAQDEERCTRTGERAPSVEVTPDGVATL